jgi:hypothetical protein
MVKKKNGKFECQEPKCNVGSIITKDGSCQGCLYLIPKKITDKEALSNHLTRYKFDWLLDGTNKESVMEFSKDGTVVVTRENSKPFKGKWQAIDGKKFEYKFKAIKDVSDLGKHMEKNTFTWHRTPGSPASSNIYFLSDGVAKIVFTAPPYRTFLGVWGVDNAREFYYTVDGWPLYTLRFNNIGTEATLLSPPRDPPSKMKLVSDAGDL